MNTKQNIPGEREHGSNPIRSNNQHDLYTMAPIQLNFTPLSGEDRMLQLQLGKLLDRAMGFNQPFFGKPLDTEVTGV